MRRPPMPPSTVDLYCDACASYYAKLSANTKRLATAICAARRQHAILAHRWQA